MPAAHDAIIYSLKACYACRLAARLEALYKAPWPAGKFPFLIVLFGFGMNVSPKQLRVFLALAETLNFSHAADRVHCTQSSLSKIVMELEATLGMTLFERSTRHVRLTDDGAEMVRLAQRIVGDYDAGIAGLRTLAMSASHKLAISALPSAAAVLLPAVVARLEAAYPALATTIYDGSSEATIKHLLGRRVDFALTSADPSRKDLVYEEILRDRFVLLSTGALGASLPPRLTLAELACLPIISMTGASTAKKYMAAAFTAKDMQFRPKIEFDQITTVGDFVRGELGIAALPYLAALPLAGRDALIVTEIEDGPVRSLGILTRRGEPLAPLAAQACREVRARAREISLREPHRFMRVRRRLQP